MTTVKDGGFSMGNKIPKFGHEIIMLLHLPDKDKVVEIA